MNHRIELDTTTLRVHVDDTRNYDFIRMRDFKPECVIDISRVISSKTCFLIIIAGEYDTDHINDMIECGRKN